MLFWILYFIFIPISFISYWIAITFDRSGKIWWKNLTVGDLMLDIGLAIIPVVNIAAPIVCILCYMAETGFFYKPVFKL